MVCNNVDIKINKTPQKTFNFNIKYSHITDDIILFSVTKHNIIPKRQITTNVYMSLYETHKCKQSYKADI